MLLQQIGLDLRELFRFHCEFSALPPVQLVECDFYGHLGGLGQSCRRKGRRLVPTVVDCGVDRLVSLADVCAVVGVCPASVLAFLGNANIFFIVPRNAKPC